jgi:mRNA interferase HigB
MKCKAKHADSGKAIDRWFNTIESSSFFSHNELKKVFPSVDYVKDGKYIFNLKGNDYRIGSNISFAEQRATIFFANTHAEYDKLQF